ncbi:unnamed protein product [Adineta steineri]|uniref:EGF-like domain-containing protein n=1 Tax=Adineta steineri TaxID=433720 RepID=A0A813Z8N1_9BILA|nr:unnamed protein product [Adineta steineri]CAF0894876.1 unnamed protein product [Adineta steineri]CAF0963883.1 unnamed protein product [Adineta steineri]
MSEKSNSDGDRDSSSANSPSHRPKLFKRLNSFKPHRSATHPEIKQCDTLCPEVLQHRDSILEIRTTEESVKPHVNNNNGQSPLITINVGGSRFQTYISTLELYPDTLLGNENKRKQYWNNEIQEYFFDRHRACFESILYYYQSNGRLRRPDFVPIDTFLEEIEFFLLGEDATAQVHEIENIKIIQQVQLPRMLWRRYIWFYSEFPQYSTLGRVINIISMILTVLFCLALTIETLPTYNNRWNNICKEEFNKSLNATSFPSCSALFTSPFFIIQTICAAFFTVEFLLRFISTPSYVSFIMEFFNWVDLCAIIPYFVLTGIELSSKNITTNADVIVGLRFFRILFFLRIFKIYLIFQRLKTLRNLSSTIKESLLDFAVMIVILTLISFLFGAAVYFAEVQSNGDVFDSIPKAVYWGVITITGVGYGEMYPITVAGRIIACLCALVGAGMMGMLVSVLVNRYQRVHKRKMYIPDKHITPVELERLFNQDHSKLNVTSELSSQEEKQNNHNSRQLSSQSYNVHFIVSFDGDDDDDDGIDNIVTSVKEKISVAIADIDRWTKLKIVYYLALSYNRPKFCHNASWNLNATTFANSSTVGMKPYDIFINTNNTVYVPNRDNGHIIIWSEGSIKPTKNISSNLSNPWSLFVTITDDIYVDSDNSTGRVDKWTLNSSIGVSTMYTCQKCADLFVDIDNNLYCSMYNLHQIMKKSLNTVSNALSIVAGTGSVGSTSNMLNSPWGIYVDVNFDLYVADYNNNRIQLFRLGQLSGKTVAGNLSLNATITLNRPTGVVLDADSYLFIVDSFNHRIVGEGPNGFRCLAGCSTSAGSASSKLYYPYTLNFDSYGNMFVTDTYNNRIQKFVLFTNSCDEISTSTINPVNISSILTTQSNNVTISSLNRVVSYNQPKFNACVSWSANASTFANGTAVGASPYGIYVNTNNTIFVADFRNSRIQIWFNNSINPTRTISGNLIYPFSLFVTSDGGIYIDNGFSNGRIDKWTLNANISIPAMYVTAACYGLFIDVNNILYCSMSSRHQVVTKSLDNNSNTTTIIAGTGCIGSTSNMLNSPWGIYVDINFDLYVADSYNNRIQLFRLGQLNGITVAGSGSLNATITLNNPTGVVLDADNYLFIVDSLNNRIVGEGPNGFRCLVGCSTSFGSASNQLNGPSALSFDSYGNMFVADTLNSRIQKFVLFTNSCEQSTTSQQVPITTLVNAIENSTNALSTFVTTINVFTTSLEKVQPSVSIFIAVQCNDTTYIGSNCNISNNICDIANPCQNNGTCINNTFDSYICLCPSGFNGTYCELDQRPCILHTCLYDGQCNETSNNTFKCTCANGWDGINCESMVNLCDSSPCMNNAVCQPTVLNYTCKCLGDNFYSGRHCEIQSKKIIIYGTISKSSSYIAILAMTIIIISVVTMDILKYCFDIDPVHKERERIRRAKRIKNRKRRVIQRCVYVNV